MNAGPRNIVATLTRSAKGFVEHDAPELGAAIAFYALLSMAPLLLIVVSLGGLFFSDRAVHNELIGQIESLVGHEGAMLAETVLGNVANDRGLGFSLTLGTVLSLIGATTVFAQLQSALNRIWGVEAAPGGAWRDFLRHRLLSFALVLTIGFLLLLSLAFNAALAAVQGHVGALAGETMILRAVNTLFTFVLAVCLMVLIFKYLPDAAVRWRDVWLGALITTCLFAVGKFAIGLYLGQASIGSWFGAAGSVVVFMIWTYYASLVFLLGAEITRSVAFSRGEPAMPVPHARKAL